MQLNLIDFGLAQPYIDEETGKHYEREKDKYMRGNFLFGSLDQLNFFKTCRRDDLISLCYMVICMLNRGDLPDLDLQRYPSMDSQQKMALIKDYKQTYSLETMCQVINEPDLCEFVREVE